MTRRSGARPPALRCPRLAWLAVAVVLGLAAPTRADVPLELRGQRIVEVRIAGVTEGITQARELGIPLGAPLTRRLVRSAVQRLAESGRWADVQIDVVPTRAGVQLVAHLVPQVTLQRVEIQGNSLLDDDELLRAMQVGQGSDFRSEQLGTMSEAAERLYAERGYEETRAQMIVRDTDDPARKVLLVQITEGQPTRIRRLQFEGTAPPRASGALGALDLEIGDVLDRPRIEEEVTEAEAVMRDRGWLEARLGPAEISRLGPRRAVVTVPSQPGPRYTLRIHGFEPLERGDVEDVLELGDEPIDPAVLESTRLHVVDLYRKHGFLDARVAVRRVRIRDVGERDEGETGPRAELRVLIDPGEQLDVVAISFPGAVHFDVDLLRDQVFSYLQEDLPGSSVLYPVDTEVVNDLGFGGRRHGAREVPRPLVVDPRRVYYEPTYDEALEHIKELYQSEGFLSARIGPDRLRRLGHGRAVVEVPVVEGPRSMLHRVELEGNEVLGDREVLVAAGLEQGQPFSYLALEQARLGILELYRDHGYLYARVEPTVRFSGDRTRAEVTFQVVERFPVTVGEVIVRGANHTDESLVRNRLSLQPGDLYRPALARESQERLLELGVFSGVNVAPQDADLPAQVKPVVVTVTERPAQYLDFTAGISTGEGARGGFEYGYRNLFGYAVGLSLRVQLAYQFLFVEDAIERRFEALPLEDRLERNITLGVGIPHLPAIPNVHWSLDLVHLRDNERDFGLDKNGVVLSAAWRPARRLTFSVAENLENNNVDLLIDVDSLDEYLRENDDPRLERLLRVPEGESTILATQVSASLDWRDSPFVPTRGWFASTRVEYARTLRTESQAELDEPFRSNFIKAGVTGSGYISLTDDVVWATQVRAGRVFHLTDGSQTYPNRSFYLGGVDTMRGYLQDAMIPQDVAEEVAADPSLQPNDVVRGGDAFVLLRSELRFPIVGQLHGGVFADVGNLWADAAELNPLDLRPTAGLGLRLATPVGPLAFDYGFILVRREALREPVGAFHFSIGLF